VVALVLFTIGSLFAAYEGIEKIRHPHELTSPAVALGVLALAIVIEMWSFRTAIRESRSAKGDEGWVEFIRHAKAPELPVVLLEDAGALLGLVLALGGVGLTLVTGEPVWDGIGTLSIGVLLGIISVVLVVEMRSLLIGEGARPRDLAAVRQALAGTPGVVSVLSLATQYLGPDHLLVGTRVELESGLTVADVARTIDAAEARVRAAVPAATPIYIEPALPGGGED